jgi:N-acetylmuramoyl-L-alanine amidase
MQNICKYKIKLNIEMRDILKNLRKIMLVMCILLIIGTIFTIVSDQNKLENTSYAKATNSSDIQLMARAINGEARGEPYEGQVAVGAVILNRVKSSQFPNSISGVIYQAGAFTAVSDGQINSPISENSTVYKAARDAINGWDPTGGCIYYFNPDTATNKWIWSRPLVKVIGKHRFCK